jgi:polysaccharide deacetylase family protein (PEP-CTERM system associated)
VLLDAGHRYSSSVYPVRHDHYGSPDAPRFPYDVRPGLLEIPLTTVRMWGRNLPAGGGGYFRLAPYSSVAGRCAASTVPTSARRSSTCIPGRSIPDQPRVPGTALKTRFRHYVNLARTEARLGRLLNDFRWGRVDEVFGPFLS